MAIITNIEEQKNKKRFNIFVDDAFFCGLNKETAVLFRLKVGKEIDENTLKEAVFESEVKSAFEKGASLLETRMHSKKELFDKLLKKNFEKNVIQKAIEKLEEYHYVDDFLFAKTFVEQNKKYSKKMIENKLLQKGVSSDIISIISEVRDDFDEIELCKKQIAKYAKGKDLSSKEMLQKMYASMLRKGFSFEIIKKASTAVFAENNEDFDFLD